MEPIGLHPLSLLNSLALLLHFLIPSHFPHCRTKTKTKIPSTRFTTYLGGEAGEVGPPLPPSRIDGWVQDPVL